MYKKIFFSLFLTMVLLLSMSLLVHAADKERQLSEPFVFEQTIYINMIQEALDSITPNNLASYSGLNVNINASDIIDDGYLLRYYLDIVLAPVHAVLDNMVLDIIASGYMDFGLDQQIIYPMSFYHELFGNIIVEMDSSNNFVFLSISYSFCNFAFKGLINQAFEIVGCDVITTRTSPYNRTASSSTRVYCPWVGVHAATLLSQVRYFRRADNVAFIQNGSHSPLHQIRDHRIVDRIQLMFNVIYSNGTLNAHAVSTFRVYFINPNGQPAGSVIRSVWMHPR